MYDSLQSTLRFRQFCRLGNHCISTLGRQHKEILDLLKKNPEGLTRVQIRNHMIRTLPAQKTDEILLSLAACERIVERNKKLFFVPPDEATVETPSLK